MSSAIDRSVDDPGYHTSTTAGEYIGSEDDARVGLLDLLVILAKYKLMIVAIPIVAAILAVIYAMLSTPIYTATAKILPPQQSQSTGSLIAQLGGLGALAGAKTAVDVYIGMLKSRTVADNIVQRFDLVKAGGLKNVSQARGQLVGATSINAGKDGIITIDVDDPEPKRAAELANAYVDELMKLTQVLAVTEASQRRLFFEKQFARAKENLSKAEATARQALQQGGLVKVDDQGKAMVEITARLRAQIAAKEVQIGAMQTFAAPGNRDLQLATQELEALRREAAKLEGTAPAGAAQDPAGGKGLGNLRLLRDLRYHEMLYELLAKQYEVARLDEAKDSAVIQVLDPAIEPESRTKPKRTLIVFTTTLIAAFVAVVLAFLREGIARAARDPRYEQRLRALRHHLYRRGRR